MKKILILLITITLLLPLITACSNCGGTEETTKEPDPIVNSFKLTKELLSQYSIIIPDNSSVQMNNNLIKLRDYIKEKTGVDLEMKDDFIKEDSDTHKIEEYEILLGATNRPESDIYFKKLRNNDYGFALVDKKLVIFGHNDASIEKAINFFKITTLDEYKDSSPYILKSGTEEVRYGKYIIDYLNINQTAINNYAVVYAATNSVDGKAVALDFCAYIEAESGYVLKCYSDYTAYNGEYEIQIGDTNRITEEMKSERTNSSYITGDTYIARMDKLIWVSGENKTALGCAKNKILSMLNIKDRQGDIEIMENINTKVKSEDIKFVSYNVRYDFEEHLRNPDDVIVSLNQMAPDVFGTIETTDQWITKLKKAYDSKYTCIPGISKDSDGSYNAIFFLTDKYTLIENGTKWLSATPDVKSKFNESKHYCIFSYVVLESKETGVRFMYVNVHLDYNSDTAKGNSARLLQTPVLINFLKQYSNLPIIIGGDFNTTPKDAPIKMITTDTRFLNSTSVAEQKIEKGTLVDAGYTTLLKWVFDYFFITKDTVIVHKYEAVDNKMNGKYPSDHLPVLIETTIYQ